MALIMPALKLLLQCGYRISLAQVLQFSGLILTTSNCLNKHCLASKLRGILLCLSQGDALKRNVQIDILENKYAIHCGFVPW